MRTRTLLMSSGWLFAASLTFAACGAGGTDDGNSLGGDTGPIAGPGGSSTTGGASSVGGAHGGSGGSHAGTSGSGGSSVIGGHGGSGGTIGLAGSGGTSGGSAGASGASGKAGSSGGVGVGGGGGAGGSTSCVAPEASCGSTSCHDLQTDPANCASCGHACKAGTNQTATCAAGVCGVKCGDGFSDCDNDPSNGCEVRTGSDPLHCGSCTATPCASGTNGTAACLAGVCALSCAAGFLDCNKTASDGCEVTAATDPANCGACGVSCGTAACVNGACQCAGVAQTAQLLPLDMYIMMDQSGSMDDQTSNGQTKWADVKTAFDGFLAASPDGISVGIQFFPAQPAGLPNNCTAASQCGAGGACDPVKACIQAGTFAGGVLYQCGTNTDCTVANGGPGGTCKQIGQCAADPTYVCPPSAFGQDCADSGGNDIGLCSAYSQCVGYDCATADYSSPAVEIAPLPGVAASITTALNQHMPGDGTPTGPALTGAVQHATTWQAAHAGHVTIVVLATDGLPTDCTPTDIPSVAAIASMGAAETPSIRTFVIGVFNTADITSGAPGNLDMIASAGGGTKTAFLVNTSQDVTAQFLAALNTIRSTALGCSYQLPQPAQGQMLDFTKVNVDYTPGGGAQTTLLNVGSAAMCTAAGGWYYDDANAPTKVELCPTTCSTISMDTMAKVDIVLGCATMKP